jgi:integrase
MGFPYGSLFQLLMLTGQRLNEVAGMRWSEIDLSGCVWSIPAERVKNGRAHSLPLWTPESA